jgi:hypothetical protein
MIEIKQGDPLLYKGYKNVQDELFHQVAPHNCNATSGMVAPHPPVKSLANCVQGIVA